MSIAGSYAESIYFEAAYQGIIVIFILIPTKEYRQDCIDPLLSIVSNF